MKQLLRYLVPAGAGLVLALGAASSSRASASDDELALDVREDVGGCKAVVGVNGGDTLCASGVATVVALREQPLGIACPGGGRAISWGTDVNGDRLLEPSEIEGNTYVCRRASSSGDVRGTHALVTTTLLAPRNGFCPAGGTLVQSGVDRDANGVLEPSEVERATFACNRFGGPSLVVSVDVTTEPAGGACASGGKRIAVGHEGEPPRISWACDAP